MVLKNQFGSRVELKRRDLLLFDGLWDDSLNKAGASPCTEKGSASVEHKIVKY